MTERGRPNLLFVFGDQWRAQAFGYAGDPNARTPNIDRFASESVHFVNAVAGCPVCSPYRASLMTGQYPLTHGVFVNDVPLRPKGVPFGEALKQAGYATAYAGKWHIDGHGRSNWIPPERHLGFDYWKVLECTHDYNHSDYFAHDDPTRQRWEGYDAEAQTRDLQAYLKNADRDRPFAFFLSWGPPHAPYETAPERFRHTASADTLTLRPNVPEDCEAAARNDLSGYYAHGAALDTCFGELMRTLDECGLSDNTIVVFTSDHGDMLGSHGHTKKQRPWEESIRVPFLLRLPPRFGVAAGTRDFPIDAPDLMPTLLSLCGVEIPRGVEGRDCADFVRGEATPDDAAALLGLHFPFHQFRPAIGGREWRGLRTRRHTYARDRNGPWLLYDNEIDPYQMNNLVENPASKPVLDRLDAQLQARLDAMGDDFASGQELVKRWGYRLNEHGDIPMCQDDVPAEG